MDIPIIRNKREVNEPIIEIIMPNGDANILTREHWPSATAIRKLILALRDEPKLLLTRINESVLEKSFRMGSAVAYCCYDGPVMEIKAFCALWSTKDENWLELGTLWISPEYRRTGVAKVIFEICDELVPQISMFLLTAEPAIAVIGIKNGWRLEGNNWNNRGTFPWDQIIGPLWERYPDSPLKEPGLLLYRMARQRKVTLLQSHHGS